MGRGEGVIKWVVTRGYEGEGEPRPCIRQAHEMLMRSQGRGGAGTAPGDRSPTRASLEQGPCVTKGGGRVRLTDTIEGRGVLKVPVCRVASLGQKGGGIGEGRDGLSEQRPGQGGVSCSGTPHKCTPPPRAPPRSRACSGKRELSHPLTSRSLKGDKWNVGGGDLLSCRPPPRVEEDAGCGGRVALRVDGPLSGHHAAPVWERPKCAPFGLEGKGEFGGP